MTTPLDQLAEVFGAVAEVLDETRRHPNGAPCSSEARQVAGDACVKLCHGDRDQARTLWKLIVADCGNYMPLAVATSLVRASDTTNLVPDVEPPEVT